MDLISPLHEKKSILIHKGRRDQHFNLPIFNHLLAQPQILMPVLISLPQMKRFHIGIEIQNTDYRARFEDLVGV